MESSEAWQSPIASSEQAKRTFNPIRDIVDQLVIRDSAEKPLVSLSIGDPTRFGNLLPSKTSLDAIREAIRDDGSSNGYLPSVGCVRARQAVADSLGQLEASDIVLTSGCSGALDIAISALCNDGDNILIPQPGFSLYRTLAERHGVECRPYKLLPDKSWEADLQLASSLVNTRTRLIVVNNPSNPCGSVYCKRHLLEILSFAKKHRLPIVADEIYGDIVFKGSAFVPLATLSTEVPILSVGGLAKQHLVPGWRLGWIAIHDRNNLFRDIRPALTKLSQLILGPNSLVQAALPKILLETPKSFFDNLREVLHQNALYCVKRLQAIPGLRVVVPQGSMYVMTEIKIDEFKDFADDVDFVQKLLTEEVVFVLPGRAFGAPNFFRIVFCPPEKQLKLAFDRMQDFCNRHHI